MSRRVSAEGCHPRTFYLSSLHNLSGMLYEDLPCLYAAESSPRSLQ